MEKPAKKIVVEVELSKEEQDFLARMKKRSRSIGKALPPVLWMFV
jgi:hypothetical protein